MIINEWDAEFTAKYGHHFPVNYLTFDTEYTGGSETDDLIMEIGHVMVENCRVIDEMSLVLNWYGYPGVKSMHLDYKLNRMRSIVGPGWKLTPDYVQKHGKDPIEVLKFYHKLFGTWKKRGLAFVAQNGQTADERLIRGSFNRFINKTFSLPDNQYFDTGAIYKATKVWEAESGDAVNHKLMMLPHRSDTLKTYFNRVIHTRVDIKWSLSLILNEYKLLEKHFISQDQLHTAGFDAMCLHWLMEEFRSRIHRSNVKENPFESADTMQRAFEQDSAKFKLENEKSEKEKPAKAKSGPEALTPGKVKRTKPAPSQRRRRRQRRV